MENNKIMYAQNITKEFCDIVRQLYIDKEIEKTGRYFTNSSKKGLLKNIEKFDDKLIDISGFVSDIFLNALNKGGFNLDFNNLYYNYDSSFAMDIYSIFLDGMNLDIADLLGSELSIKMIGNNQKTKLTLFCGIEPVVCRKIENKDLTNDDNMVR